MSKARMTGQPKVMVRNQGRWTWWEGMSTERAAPWLWLGKRSSVQGNPRRAMQRKEQPGHSRAPGRENRGHTQCTTGRMMGERNQKGAEAAMAGTYHCWRVVDPSGSQDGGREQKPESRTQSGWSHQMARQKEQRHQSAKQQKRKAGRAGREWQRQPSARQRLHRHGRCCS